MKRLFAALPILALALAACSKDTITGPDNRGEIVTVYAPNADVSLGLSQDWTISVFTTIVGRNVASLDDTTHATIDNPALASVTRVGWSVYNTGYDVDAQRPTITVEERYKITSNNLTGNTIMIARSKHSTQTAATTQVYIRDFGGKG